MLLFIVAVFEHGNVFAQCAPVPSGLVSWYPGEGNANDIRGGNNGTLQNGVTFAAGKVASAFNFNGTGGITIADTPALKPQTISIEAWVKPTFANRPRSPFDIDIIFGKSDTNKQGYDLFISQDPNVTFGGYPGPLPKGTIGFQFFASNGTIPSASSSTTIPDDGAFHHVAVTYDGSVINIYLDGALVGQKATQDAIKHSNVPATIGFTDAFTRNSIATIDEVSIYNRALSQTEVQTIVNAGSAGKCQSAASCATPPSGLVSWFPAENTTADVIGGNNGTAEGNLTYASGKVGRAFNLDGTTADVKVPASSSLNVGTANGLTIDAWINPTDVSTQQPIVEWNNGNIYGTHFYISVGPVGGFQSGTLYANLVDTNGNNHSFASNTGLITSNAFQHVALTYDKSSGQAQLYLNGASIASTNLGTFTPQTSYDAYLGVRAGGPGVGFRFGGILDEVHIYNRALSQSEIQSIVNADSAGVCRLPLIAGRILDVSGNPLANTTVNLTGTQNARVQTDALGYYSFVNLASGGNYTITPLISNQTLSPGARTFNNLTSDQAFANFFVAPNASFQITGRVTDATSGAALKNIQVNLSGAETKTTRTDANGNYTFSNLVGGGNFTVKATDANLTFTPAAQTFNSLTANQTQNFTAILSTGLPPVLPSDDFSSNQRDPTKFQLGTLTQPAGAFDPTVSTVQQNGQLVITPISGANGLHYNGYVSTDSIDFTGGTASLEVVQVAKGGAETVFALGNDADNFFRFVAGGAQAGANVKRFNGILDDATPTQLVFQVKQNGVLQSIVIPYDPVQHRFWRLRNDQTISTNFPNGAIVFETAPDNQTFTERFRAAIQKPINALALEISAGTSQAVTNPGSAVFDNLQLNANSIDGASFYVAQHYRDFLNRQADIGGLQFWTNEVFSCGADAKCIDIKRQNVSAAYFLSIEFQQTGFLVYKLYKASFGNIVGKPVPVRFANFLPDVQSIGSGVIVGQTGYEQKLEANKVSFITAFVTRPAFKAQYPDSLTAAQYVDQLNANTGNSLTADQRNQLVNGLTTGTETRATVLRKVAENDQFTKVEFNQAFVLMQYFGYLRRDPDSGPDTDFGGYFFWLNKLTSFNGDYIRSEMVRSFTISTEYRKRFGKP